MMKALEIDEPPELYYVMRSICDYDKSWDEQTKIINLAKNSRKKLFYDTYPLNDNVSRETFEIDILNHFIYRRIGFDTVTGFKIALVTKLREIMPKYNMMFDLMFRDIFTDTETEEFNSRKDNEGGYQTGTERNERESQTDNKKISKSGNFTENTETSTTEDLRNSDTPQNKLADVRSGEYVSEFNYNQRNGEEEKRNTHSDTETQTDTLSATKTGNENQTNIHNDTDTLTHEKLRKNTAGLLDKLGLLQEYNSIMEMIYKDLDCLFLGVFDY